MPAIIFDLDGVLIDSEELQYEAYRRVLREFGVEIGREEYGREWIAGGRGAEYAVAAYKLDVSAAELRARKNPVYHRIMREEVQLMPSVLPTLERLRPHFPLAVATNSNTADVGYVMQRFRLRPFFQAVIARETYAAAKPEPDAFLAAAAALRLPAAECVVIEDAHRGVVAAYRAGAKCIAVPHPFTADHDFQLADRVISGLQELTLPLLKDVLAAPKRAS